ncbi:MAG: DUF2795 domain-containing protein [Actinomycetota bacterium]
MDFNPEEASRYLDGVEYPAGKAEIASAAEGNNAPEVLVERIKTLGRNEFSSEEEVVAELRASPRST